MTGENRPRLGAIHGIGKAAGIRVAREFACVTG